MPEQPERRFPVARWNPIGIPKRKPWEDIAKKTHCFLSPTPGIKQDFPATFDSLSSFHLKSLTRIIDEGFYCNCVYAATTSLAVAFARPGGRARPARSQRTVSSTSRPLGAPHARLAWRLRSFVTNLHE